MCRHVVRRSASRCTAVVTQRSQLDKSTSRFLLQQRSRRRQRSPQRQTEVLSTVTRTLVKFKKNIISLLKIYYLLTINKQCCSKTAVQIAALESVFVFVVAITTKYKTTPETILSRHIQLVHNIKLGSS